MEQFEQRREDLRNALFLLMAETDSTHFTKVWTAVEVNIPAKWFPGGYTLEMLDDAIKTIKSGRFDINGSYTNSVLRCITTKWRSLLT